ncbi:MAG: choice-of-anchor L domain-containing protein [Bacteroidetes bacterium]|nr:choice-of-anchor L domain-containing protein [Bacteroidota bacterium]
MNKNFQSLLLGFAIAILMPFSLQAQFGSFTIIRCEDSAAVIALIDTVFLKGVNPSQYKNITFKGDPYAVGYFYDGFMFGGFQTKKGIVMSSGYAGELDKTNNCSNQVVSYNTTGGSDVDLASLVSTSINDACVIEFDFKPTNQISSFRYVFGSEEYPEYVGGSFNDVFGFFLSGDGINGTYSNNAVNIALIPNTSLPVSINNVNCGNTNPNCQPGPGGTYCDLLIENIVTTSPAFKQLALNAYTIAFTADNATTPCSWYHIKLAIGDAGDSAWDSGVFLEMGSFDPGKITESTNYTHPTVDSLLYESCNNHEAILYFDIGSERTEDFTIPFTVEGTATQGMDYLLFSSQPGKIFIPAGQTYDSIVIRPFADTLVEGIEDIQIKYIPVICGMGFEETVTILLSDVPDFADTNLVFNSVCEDTITLGFNDVLSGIPPYTYRWLPDNQSTAWLDYSITGSDSVAVPCVVTDTCGYQVVDTAFVKVPALQADAGPDKSLCNLPSVQLEGSSAGAQHFMWVANPPDATLTTPAIPDPIVSPLVNTTYTLTVSDNCTHSDDDEAQVFLDVAVADAGEDQSMCAQQSVTLECNPGLNYVWTSNPPDPGLPAQAGNQTITVSPAGTTQYFVDVTNDCGFTASDEVVVVVNPLPVASAGNDNEICLNESYSLQGSGGIHYLWSSIPDDPTLHVNQQDTLANPTITPDTQTDYIYTVSVTNGFGCESEASMNLAVNPIPNVSVTTTNTTICLGDSTTLTAVGNADYTWTADINDPGLTGQIHNQVIKVSPTVTTTYTLTGVVSGFNCPATIEQTIVVIPETTANFSAMPFNNSNSFVFMISSFPLLFFHLNKSG